MRVPVRTTGVFQEIPFHTLSLRDIFDLQGKDTDKLEVITDVISRATDETPEEVTKWIEASDYQAPVDFLTEIMALSGVATEEVKN